MVRFVEILNNRQVAHLHKIPFQNNCQEVFQRNSPERLDFFPHTNSILHSLLIARLAARSGRACANVKKILNKMGSRLLIYRETWKTSFETHL